MRVRKMIAVFILCLSVPTAIALTYLIKEKPRTSTAVDIMRITQNRDDVQHPTTRELEWIQNYCGGSDEVNNYYVTPSGLVGFYCAGYRSGYVPVDVW